MIRGNLSGILIKIFIWQNLNLFYYETRVGVFCLVEQSTHERRSVLGDTTFKAPVGQASAHFWQSLQ